jgi:hypothetical protein
LKGDRFGEAAFYLEGVSKNGRHTLSATTQGLKPIVFPAMFGTTKVVP